MRTPDPTAALIRSENLALGQTEGGHSYAYHRLFGNFSWLDSELFHFLSPDVPRPESLGSLSQAVGSENADALYDSYYFVNSVSEEREEIAKLLKDREAELSSGKFVTGLQISSSNACNFACSYCFADTSESRSPVRSQIAGSSPNISLEMAANAIEEVRSVARAHGNEQIVVKFLGREPLINWKVIAQLFDRYDDRSVQWAITTNGSLITDRVASSLRDHGVRVVVSLDGDSKTNDAHRISKSTGGGTYEMVETGLHRLADAGVPFGISSVISSASDFDEMRAFAEHLRELGASELELTLAMQTANLAEVDVGGRDDESEEQFVEQLVDLSVFADRLGLHVHGDWLDPFRKIMTTHKYRDDTEIARPLGASCTATSHQISIEPTGDLFPCRAMSLHYGHIDDLRSILAGEGYKKVAMRTYFNVPYCQGCNLEGFCQGTCLGSSEEAFDDIYSPQEDYCTIYRRATERLLARLECPFDSELSSVPANQERAPCL